MGRFTFLYTALVSAFISVAIVACSGGTNHSVLPTTMQSNVGTGGSFVHTESVNPSPIIGGVIAGVNGTAINIQGGGSCGYVNVYYSGSTQINLNGLTLTSGVYATVYGTGNCNSSFTATTISLSGTTVAVTGTIYAINGSTISLQAGGSCGYVNVAFSSGTAIWQNGFALGPGASATVYGTGSCATSFTATRIVLTGGPAPTPTPSASASPAPNLTGTIYAVNGNTINVNGGAGCGYVNATYNGSTQIVYNGYTLTKGTYLSLWGTGSCETSFVATTIVLGVPATPTPSPSPTAPPVVLTHVPTGDYCCGGYNNDTPAGGLSTAGPWISFYAMPAANADPTGTYPSYGTPGLAAAGIAPSHVYMYVDDSRVYNNTTQYANIAPGGVYASAEARDCSGNPITVSNHTGYLSDPNQPATVQIYDADVTTEYNSSTEYGLVYLDDINGYGYNDNGAVPCYKGAPWSQPSTAGAYASLINAITVSNLALGHAPPTFVINSLGPMMIEANGSAATLQAEIAAITAFPTLWGIDCESCISDTKNAEIGTSTPYELTNQWQLVEDAAIALVNAHKTFWLQDQDSTSTSTASYNGRLYAFASYMLTWDPNYTVYQNFYYGHYGDGQHPNSINPQIHVFPEEALVAYSPIGPYPSTSAGIAALKDPNGTYVREYQMCYYQGTLIGGCAFVVNPDTATHPSPTLQRTYGHRMALTSQNDVLDGGTAILNGYSMGTSVPGLTGYVLLP